MGKKKTKKDQKGKGAEKTAQKTERKAEKKSKKMLQEKGEVGVLTQNIPFPYHSYVEGVCAPHHLISMAKLINL